MAVNNLYQPCRAILSMINQCLTCKTSGFDRPRYPILQMLWGIITSINVNYAELIWEEFIQVIQTFLIDKANLGSPTKKGRKDKPHVIPYCWFTKLIICHLGRKHNLHQRSESSLHLAEEDLHLRNIKFVPKAEKEGKKKLISKVDPLKKPANVKQLKPKPVKEKSRKLALASKPKVTQEKPVKPSPEKHPKRDEPSQPEPEPEPEPEHQGEGEEYDAERAIQMSLELFQSQVQAHVGGVAIREPIAKATRPLPLVEGKGKAITTEEQAAQSLFALHTPKRRIHDSPSPAGAETGADTDKTNRGGDSKILQIGDEQGEDVDNQAGPDPRESHVAFAGPNLEPTHDEFMANVYPDIHESLKFPADEHVILEDPLSSSRTLSLMKNLDDAYTIWDKFLNDKSTKDELEKLNVEA
ncbi:hypothetical protein Tco_1357521 [Tanacetum coccineum]